MHIQDIFRQHATTVSFEFFPPKTDEASAELFANIASLQSLKPSFVSVTYGAGGSTRERTHDLVIDETSQDSLLDPDAIADSYLHLIDQPRTSWSWEIEVRPWLERF